MVDEDFRKDLEYLKNRFYLGNASAVKYFAVRKFADISRAEEKNESNIDTS